MNDAPLRTEPLAPHEAAGAFAALGSEQRLAVLRVLVRAGDPGLPVGTIAQRTGLPGSTLSHHLRLLAGAGLLRQRKDGRRILCRADHEAVRRLSEYLMAECCADLPKGHDHG